MTLDNTAVMRPGTGHFLLRTASTASPSFADLEAFVADTTDLPTGCVDLGHTSLNDVLAFEQDGGESTVIGSWQTKSLKEIVTSEAVDYFTTTALQLDNDTLALYYGAGDATVANEWSAPENFSTTEKGVTIVMFDGSDWVAIDCGRVSIRREAGLAPDPEYFLGLPLRFTLLSPSGGVKKLKWIADQLGAA
jgi:hypothetical protein